MPINYQVEGTIVRLTLVGDNRPELLIQTFLQALDDPETPSQFGLFLDTRQSTSLQTQPSEEIIRVAEFLGPYKNRVQRCAVLATEDIHFGLARMGAVYSEAAGVMTRVFRDGEEATGWLIAGPVA
jgi:hypothetical protein